jgi:LPXTG-site transpeptidase (sortase) family protein
MIRRMVSGIGRTFITTGVLMLLFVAYQLWGTGIATAQDQKRLGNQFKTQLAASGITLGDPLDDPSVNGAAFETIDTLPDTLASATTVAPVQPSEPADPGPTVPDTTLASPGPTIPAAPVSTLARPRASKTVRVNAKPGEAIALIKIPKIRVDDIVVAGTSKETLKKGPGHYPGTPLPGSPGNAAIAGHRTTYGAPFFNLHELKVGDPIFTATVGTGRWSRYVVSAIDIVKPSQNEVLLRKGDRNTLTLTTCHPQYSAKQRLIITADLVGPAVEQEFTLNATAAELAEQELSGEDTGELDGSVVSTTTTAATTASTVANPTDSVPVDSVPVNSVPVDSVPVDSVPVDSVPDTTAAPALAEASPPASTPAAPEAPRLDGRTDSGGIKFWWFRGTASQWTSTAMWAGICALIALAIWLVARPRKQLFVRWGICTAGTLLVFMPTLYFAFEALARLLPENV